MATTIEQRGSCLSFAVTHPASPSSGDPVRLGSITGIAITDEGDGGNASTDTSVEIGLFVTEQYVDDDGGAGISVGDKIYYDDTATGDPETNLNVDSVNGVFFGFALEAVAADATTKIKVLHLPMADVS